MNKLLLPSNKRNLKYIIFFIVWGLLSISNAIWNFMPSIIHNDILNTITCFLVFLGCVIMIIHIYNKAIKNNAHTK